VTAERHVSYVSGGEPSAHGTPSSEPGGGAGVSQLVEANPLNGGYWWHLAEARARAGDLWAAAKAFERAEELGFSFPAEAAYRAARCYAADQRRDLAIAALTRALNSGYRRPFDAWTDDAFVNLTSDPSFVDLVPRPDQECPDRDQRWRTDLALLASEVTRRSKHVMRATAPTEFAERVHDLAARVSDLSDQQISAEVMRLVASLGDGHSKAEPCPSPPLAQDMLPIKLYDFDEGLFVIAASPEYSRTVGSKLVAIENVPINEARSRLTPLISHENTFGLRSRLPSQLVSVRVLQGIGLVRDPASVRVALEGPADGCEQIVLDPIPPVPSVEDSRLISPSDWAFMPRLLRTPLPHYLRRPETNYWMDDSVASGTIYIQFNEVHDAPGQNLLALARSITRQRKSTSLKRVIIDVRWNTGGNTFLLIPVLRGLWDLGLPGAPELVVIIGRRTFSAAQNFVSYLERFGNPIFVGEPTGSRPNAVGDHVEFILPHSGMRIAIGDLYWQAGWPMDFRPWIAPHVYVPVTFRAFSENRDPALTTILETAFGGFDYLRSLGGNLAQEVTGVA
jgi:hypothetical protein